jgi:methionyl-tRNA formyltransferase
MRKRGNGCASRLPQKKYRMTKPSILVFTDHTIGHDCLDLLVQNDEYVIAVITHKDDSAENRGGAVSSLARKYGIPLYSPPSVNTPAWIDQIRTWQPDLILSFSYKYILGEDILRVPSLGCFNLHCSLLPKYRGIAPVAHAVMQGEQMTGVTLHVMTKEPNAGEIVDQESVVIAAEDTAQDVSDKCIVAARTVLERQIEALEAGTAPRKPQHDADASLVGIIRPEECRIDWTLPAQTIYNHIRALTQTHGGAFTEMQEHKLFVWWAVPKTGIKGSPGQILTLDPLTIAAADGGLELVNWEWDDQDENDASASKRRLMTGQVIGK